MESLASLLLVDDVVADGLQPVRGVRFEHFGVVGNDLQDEDFDVDVG